MSIPARETAKKVKAVVAAAVADLESGSHDKIVASMTNHVSAKNAERMLRELHDEIMDVGSYLDAGEIDEAHKTAISAAHKFALE